MRLNRYLSLCGFGSRRGCEEIILQGRVSINDQQVKELASQVNDGDEVKVDGRRVSAKTGVVIVLHKPRGYLCTREDTHGRATIYDLLPARFHNLHHVGRLDLDSEGLILLTNRGDLSQRLLHPSEGVEKEYCVRLETEFDPAHIAKLLHGVSTKEGWAKAERAWLENPYVLNVVLKQGLKRQIRLMFYMLGYEVERLIRTRIGGLKLHGLPKGQWRQLTDHEVEKNFEKRSSRPRTLAKPKKKAAAPDASSDDDFFAPTARKKPTPVSSLKKDTTVSPKGGSRRSSGRSDKPFAAKKAARRPGGKTGRPSSARKPRRRD